MPSQLLANPTLETLSKVQHVLESEGVPMTRYQIHKALRAAVNYPVIEAVLRYLSELRLIVDEGPRGRVLWVHTPKARALLEASRRVA